MDSEGFISSVESNLVSLAPITKFIIKKQLNDLKLQRASMTPDQAIVFIDKMTAALIMCLGNDGSQLARKMMLKQLRMFAPEFFAKKNGQVGFGSSSSV
jgi:hypothetical protein